MSKNNLVWQGWDLNFNTIPRSSVSPLPRTFLNRIVPRIKYNMPMVRFELTIPR